MLRSRTFSCFALSLGSTNCILVETTFFDAYIETCFYMQNISARETGMSPFLTTVFGWRCGGIVEEASLANVRRRRHGGCWRELAYCSLCLHWCCSDDLGDRRGNEARDPL